MKGRLGPFCLIAFVVVAVMIGFTAYALPLTDEYEENTRLLFKAIRSRNYSEVERLFHCGVSGSVQFGNNDPDIMRTSDGGLPYCYKAFTPLHALAISQNVATKPVYDVLGDDAQITAAAASDLAIAACIIRYGGLIELETALGETPIDVALTFRNDQLAGYLIALGQSRADVSAVQPSLQLCDCVPETPFTLAIVLQLGGVRHLKSDVHAALEIAIASDDWESCHLIQHFVGTENIDASLISKIRRKPKDNDIRN